MHRTKFVHSLRESSVYLRASVRFCARAKEICVRAGRFALAHYILIYFRSTKKNALSTFGIKITPYAAARILTRTRKSEHITPVLRSLHWLPVTFRIDFNDFKVLLLIYKPLNGLGLQYIAEMLTEYKPNRSLRSLGSKQGQSAFSYNATCNWNQLPEEIRCAKSLAIFKSRLKTHLFSCAFAE